MVYNPLSVIAQYFPFDDFMFTYNLAAGIAVTDEGKAVQLDTAASNQMKLVTNGSTVDGRLFKFEDRTQQGGGLVGTVERKLRAKLTYTGTAPVVGDFVCGSATPGIVRKLVIGTDTGALQNCRVIDVDATASTVTVELF
jgi:hypothetical protein